MKKAYNSYGKMYGGYSTHSLPTRNAEILSEDKKEIDRPKYVTEKAEYFEKEKGYDPDYAFPMAWSIYCKYKNPSSPRCTRDEKDYLINQGVKDPKKMKKYPKKASAKKVASQYMKKQASLESSGEKEAILNFFKKRSFSFNAFLPIGMPSIMRDELDWGSLLNMAKSYGCKNTHGRRFKWDYVLLRNRKYIVVCSGTKPLKDHLRITSNENFTYEELNAIAKAVGVELK